MYTSKYTNNIQEKIKNIELKEINKKNYFQNVSIDSFVIFWNS